MTATTPTRFIGVGLRWEIFRFDSGSLGNGPFEVDAGLGNDVVIGGIGDDSLVAGGGADMVIGDAGHDLIYGDTTGWETSGDGNDFIFGGGGRDTIYGGGGENRLQGGDDADLIFGGSSTDLIDGGAGADILVGGEGDDLIRGNGSQMGPFSVFYAWDGTTDIYLGGPRTGGQDVPLELVVSPSAFGDDSAGDWLSGGEGHDTMIGDGGSDTLYGDAGNDWLFGDNGQSNPSYSMWDPFDAISGNDLLFGGDGNDTLHGGAGNNWLDGGAGDDLVSYSGLNGVTVFLNHGMAFRAGGEADTLVSIERLWGSESGDWIVGRNGADMLEGGRGNDWLFGLDGNDMIFGGGGPIYYDYWNLVADSDQIIGGKGSDTIYGGGDNDQFWFLAEDFELGVYDYIMDFGETPYGSSIRGMVQGPNFDYLRFEGIAASQLTFTDYNGYCHISTLSQNNNGGVIVVGVKAAQLADQLIFA